MWNSGSAPLLGFAQLHRSSGGKDFLVGVLQVVAAADLRHNNLLVSAQASNEL